MKTRSVAEHSASYYLNVAEEEIAKQDPDLRPDLDFRPGFLTRPINCYVRTFHRLHLF
jgi:hypothetical protein